MSTETTGTGDDHGGSDATGARASIDRSPPDTSCVAAPRPDPASRWPWSSATPWCGRCGCPSRADETIDPQTGLFVEGGFAGFDNYTHWLLQQCGGQACPPGTNAASFWEVVGITVGFTVVTVAIELVLGFWFAIIMNGTFRGRGLVRAAVLIPWAIPTAVTAKLWLLHLRLRRHRQQPDGHQHRVVRRQVGGARRDRDQRRLEDDTVHGAPDPRRAPADRLRTSTRPRRSTAPRPGSGSGTSRCRW